MLLCRRHNIVKLTLLLVLGIVAINVVEDLMYKYDQHQVASVQSRVLRDNSELYETGSNSNSNQNHVDSAELQHQHVDILVSNRKRIKLDNNATRLLTKHETGEPSKSTKPKNITGATSDIANMDNAKQTSKVVLDNKLKCPTKLNLDLFHFICKPHRQPQSQITLFTALFNLTAKDVFIIKNTLSIWSQLMPHIRPVLFVLYSEHNDPGNELLGSLTKMACDLGWSVIPCPHCRDGLPVLGSLFHTVYATMDTTWYGYSQSHVLFDDSLLSALNKLQFYIKRIRPYGLLAGSQYFMQV